MSALFRASAGRFGAGLLVLSLLAASGLHAQSAQELPPKTITINAVEGLQYDRVRFAVQPGQQIELTLDNISSLAHNLIITAPGTRQAIVAAANRMGVDGLERDYVPRSDSVLHVIPVLDPGEQYTLTFTAPSEEGVYPYVCTYPGHGVIMYGAMYVSSGGEAAMPPIADDTHVPPDRLRADAASTASVSAHPYSTTPPIVYRTFMPESSPASIAVGLEGELSYCFDTTPVMLRYAWQGGFVDNSEVFRGHVSEQRATIEGDVFYRNAVGFPLRIGSSDAPPDPVFKGYEMIDGRPQFEYMIGSVRVRELIEPTPDRAGLQRTFQLDGADRPVRFLTSPQDSVAFEASAGTWDGNTLRLQPSEAQRFVITMTPTTSNDMSRISTPDQATTQNP